MRGPDHESDLASECIDAVTFATLLKAHPDMGSDQDAVLPQVLQDVYEVVLSSSERLTQGEGAAATNPLLLTTGPARAVWVPHALLSSHHVYGGTLLLTRGPCGRRVCYL